jgi:hypothetical protein
MPASALPGATSEPNDETQEKSDDQEDRERIENGIEGRRRRLSRCHGVRLARSEQLQKADDDHRDAKPLRFG